MEQNAPSWMDNIEGSDKKTTQPRVKQDKNTKISDKTEKKPKKTEKSPLSKRNNRLKIEPTHQFYPELNLIFRHSQVRNLDASKILEYTLPKGAAKTHLNIIICLAFGRRSRQTLVKMLGARSQLLYRTLELMRDKGLLTESKIRRRSNLPNVPYIVTVHYHLAPKGVALLDKYVHYLHTLPI